jgi:hypothetical protein
MRSLLLVLAFTCVSLLGPAPALAQTSQGSPSGDQYDPGLPPDSGGNVVGDGTADGAVQAALMASGALQATPEEAQATGGSSVSADESSAVPSERDAAFAEEGGAASSTESASAAAVQDESASTAGAQGESANTSGLEKLPQTGGPSPLWLFGAPLICIGGILARRIVLA